MNPRSARKQWGGSVFLIGMAVGLLMAGVLVKPAGADIPDVVDYHAEWTGAGGWQVLEDKYGYGPPVWGGPDLVDLTVQNIEIPDYVKLVLAEAEWDPCAPTVPPPIDLSYPTDGVTQMIPYATNNALGYNYRWILKPQPAEESLAFPESGQPGHPTGMAKLEVATLCLPADQVYCIQKPLHLYGKLSQGQVQAAIPPPPPPPPVGNSMCGPTAAVNSLVYLENAHAPVYNRSLVPDPDGNGVHDVPEMVSAALILANANHMNTQVGGAQPGGTWADMFIYGKHKYIEAAVPGQTIYGAQMTSLWVNPPVGKPAWVEANTPPTWQFIHDNLEACEDVEILITGPLPAEEQAGDEYNYLNGGHYLTVTSFCWADANNDGYIDKAENAILDYIDPVRGLPRAGRIYNSIGVDGRTYLTLDYPPPGFPGMTVPCTVAMAVKESIPEPATLSLLALGACLPLLRRRARLRRAAT